MHQNDLLNKRNLFVYYTISAINILYFTMMFVGIFKEQYPLYIIFTTASIIALGVSLLLKAHSRFVQIALLISWNISAVLLVCESNYLITFFWFIFILLITSIYNSFVINITSLTVVCIEVVIILNINYNLLFQPSNRENYISIFFICMIVLLCTLQVFFIRKLWRSQERITINREHELSSKEGYLRYFFQNADDAIAVYDLDSKIIDLNPAFERLYGWTREESVGRSLPIVPPQHIEESNERYLRLLQGESFHFNTQDMHKDGRLIDVQLTLSPIFNQHGKMIASSVISRDASFQKENERLVMQSEKLKVVGEIAAGLAHEIRNPLTVVSGFVQMMNADENFPYKSYTTLIETEIDRINLIISEFLVLSKPQKEQFKKFPIKEALAETIQLFSLQITNKHVALTFIDNDVQAFIEGSYNQIKQVFINLLKNALEAVDEGGKIHIELCEDNGDVYIYIQDDGIGIPPHIVDRIFEPFFTTKESGTGLGMVITNKIIQEHNGTLQIRSKEKVGTELLIKLRIVTPDPENID